MFDSILNTKVTLDAMSESTIVKCFRQCGINELMAQLEEFLDVTPPTCLTDVDVHFRKLLKVPRDQHMAYEDKLQSKQPSKVS